MNLDLHGVKHENVVRLVDVFIWQCMQTKKKNATIITGNSDTMKKIVEECLNEHGIKLNSFSKLGGSITFDL
jgi:DNA-nicking Smr family endonuclease